MKNTRNVLNFKVIFSQDEDGIFVATCPAIPGCHTQGDTFEKAEENIKEAIALCLKVAQNDKEYRASIDFQQDNDSRFIGIGDVIVPRPEFL